MKSVIKSLHPEVCERIASGKQTIIVAKSAPKEVPFKAYIYCTKKPVAVLLNGTGKHISEYDKTYCYNERSGKVIGEFICDKVEKFTVGSFRSDEIEKLACLTYEELIEYFYKPYELDGKTIKFGYAWHISNLKIYDKPKELGEFCTRRSNKTDNCDTCINKKWWKEDTAEIAKSICAPCQKDNFRKQITRAPQSWCYVENLEGGYVQR